MSSKKPQNPGISGDLAAMLSDRLGHHQPGRLEEADAMYRLILTADPEHADANHFLGVLCFQTGRDEFERLTGARVLHDDSVDQMADMDTFTAQVAAHIQEAMENN